MSYLDDLARMRREYGYSGIDRPAMREDDGFDENDGFDESSIAADWPTQFGRWFADAVAAGLPEPNAMILATATADARPSARTVLLKGYDQNGFVFFTNLESRKGREVLANPAVSLVFPWFAMSRQVVVCGRAAVVDRSETDGYFRRRPRGAQLGAWASAQSSVLSDRAALEEAYLLVEQRFPDEVPTPPNWGGFRVHPETVEFWQGRRSRLHDRLQYRRDPPGWIVERLAP